MAHFTLKPLSLLAVAFLLLFSEFITPPVQAQSQPAVKVHSRFDFETTLGKLAAAAKQHKIGIVNKASAQQGAAAIGVKIPGNQVWGLFHPRFAVRMLKASVDAGYEAPVRLYIVEAPDGQVTVRYRKPSVVFKPYRNRELDEMALELDIIFARVVAAVR